MGETEASDERHRPGWQIKNRWNRGDEPEFGRMAFFTDAVFAIALTLLVLDIRLPGPVSDSPSDMWAALGNVQSQLIAFVVAFALLGRYWLTHHTFVAELSAITSRLMALNLVYLAFVALLPFPTSLVGTSEGNPVSVLVFALTLAAISAMETVLFTEAHRAGLLTAELRSEEYRYAVMGSLSPVVILVVTAPFAFVSPTATLLSWLVLSPVMGMAVNSVGSRYGVDVRRQTKPD